MAATYKDNGGSVNGSNKEFTYDFPTLQTEDVKVALNGATQATNKYTVSLSPAKITFNATSIDPTVQTNDGSSNAGAPLAGVTVRVYRETAVGKASGDEDPKAVFAAGSSIRAVDLNANVEQALFGIHELQDQPFTTEDLQDGSITSAKLLDGTIVNADIANTTITGAKLVNDTVTATQIAADAITASELADDAVDTDAIADNAVTMAKLNSGALPTDVTVASANLVDGTIVNADINNSAAIAHSKLSGISGGNVLLGNSSNVPTSTALSGDVTVNNSGVTTIGNDKIDSQHYVAGSIDLEHMSANSVDSDQYVDGSIDNAHLANDSVGTSKIIGNAVTVGEIADNAVTGTKIINDSIDSQHYVDGSIDRVHLAADIVDGTKIADDSIDHEHLAANSVREAAILDNAVTNSKLTTNAVTSAKLAINSVGSDKISDNAVTADKIADAVIVTASEQASHSVNDTTFFTTSAAEARYFNASTGETIKDGQSFPDNDTTIATTAAINDRIIDLVDDVGGFVPIANETSFPNANPDVNNGTGTIVSIGELASNHTSNGSGVISISNGTVGNSTVTINGAANNTTYSAGYGLLVETTTTLNTYTFHRLTTKATEVTTVAGSISNVNTVAGSISNVNAVAGNASNINAVAADATDIGAVAGKATEIGRLGTADAVSDMNTLGTTAIVSDMDTLADISSNISTVAGISSNVTTVAGVQANVTTVAGIHGNVTTVAGNNSNVTTVAGNISDVNNFADLYQIASSNPSADGGGNSLAAGDLYFNTSANELKVYNGSAWQGGVTASGNFASTTGNTFTGNNIYNDGVHAKFGTGSDLAVYHSGTVGFISNDTGDFRIQNNDANWIYIEAKPNENSIVCKDDGTVELYYDNAKKLETTADGISVPGDIAASGHIGPLGNNKILKLGADTDMKVYSSGLNGYIENVTGELWINSDTIWLRAVNNEVMMSGVLNGMTELRYDGTTKFETTSAGVEIHGTLQMDDNKIARFGNDGDLQIYHTGSESRISDRGGVGALFIESNDLVAIRQNDASHYMAKFHQGGAAELYHNNSKKLETSSTGILVSGTSSRIQSSGEVNLAIGSTDAGGAAIYLDGDSNGDWSGSDYASIKHTTGGDIVISADNPSNDGHIYLQVADGTEKALIGYANGAVELYYDNSNKLQTESNGVRINGILKTSITSGQALSYGDNAQIHIGTGDDLQIYHDGSNSYLDDTGTGHLYLKTNSTVGMRYGTDDIAEFIAAGAVKLYYDNVKKLETTAAGANIYHTLNVYGASGGSNANIALRCTGSAVYNTLSFYDNAGSSNAYITSWQGDDILFLGADTFVFCSGGPERWMSNSSYLSPRGTDGSYNLGDTSRRWGEVYVKDSKKIRLGDGDDLQLYHNGTHNYIDSTNGKIHIRHGSENAIVTNANGAVELYHNNVKTFQTGTHGASVHAPEGGSAQFYLYADEGDDNADEWGLIASHSSSKFSIDNYAGGGWETSLTCEGNGAAKLFYDDSSKIETASTGATITGNHDLRLTNGNWTGESCKIQHHSNYLYLQGGSNGILFRAIGGTNRLWVDPDGHFKPMANNTYDLGSTNNRWRNVYTGDLQLSNKGSTNEVDGTWGNFTIQEGEDDLFLINRRNGKKYKFNLTEVS